MLDRVRIWTTEVKTHGEDEPIQVYVHYELTGTDETIIAHGAIPYHEWIEMRNNVIQSYPGNVSVSLLTDYIAVLGELIDN